MACRRLGQSVYGTLEYSGSSLFTPHRTLVVVLTPPTPTHTTPPTRCRTRSSLSFQPEMNIQGFKPEPIAIPVAAGPSGMDLQLSASGCDLADALDSARCYPSCAADGASHSVDPKAAARQLDSDRLIASLANSEIQPDELQMVCSIGHGSSGNVSQVLHMPTSSVLALKSIPVDADEASRKAILLELKALHDCTHAAIVSFYGAFFREGAVHIALEYS